MTNIPSSASDTWSDAERLQADLRSYHRALDTDVVDRLIAYKRLVLACRDQGRKVIFAGNGASAAISSHAAVDFTKAAGVRGVNFNEADLITCFGNDFGYEQWMARAIEYYADPGDVITLISSSGKSPNVLRAAEYARQRQLTVVTLTGFDANNPLRQLGDLELWVDSRSYNVVETTHQTWLLLVCDLIAATAPRGGTA